MPTKSNRNSWGVILVALLATQFAAMQPAEAQRERRSRGDRVEQSADYAAVRMYRRAMELIESGEGERAVRMLETVLEQYPEAEIRHKVYLELGRHHIERHELDKALGFLRNTRSLVQPGAKLTREQLDIYLEGTYLSGIAFFQLKQYSSAFPTLRKITNEFPNTVWANQAYYYIGLCHFAQERWNKAIDALNMVGTFVDADQEAIQFVEAGHRFYVKIEDTDLPVLQKLGYEVKVDITTKNGDKETITCVSLARDSAMFIGSIATKSGTPTEGDGTLQIIGGDSFKVEYKDNNTQEGEHDISRLAEVRVISTGGVTYTLGTYESQAPAAFQGQPLFMVLADNDLDLGADKDSTTIKLVSRYKAPESEADIQTGAVSLDDLFGEEEDDDYIIRDEVTITLEELGESPFHSGKFGGFVEIESFKEGLSVDRTNSKLTCALDDEVVATYVDALHIEGELEREVSATIQVAGEIDSRPRATQDVVFDPVVKARKNLVEGEAYLELARIFKSMGLIDGATTKANEGLERVEPVIRERTPIPKALQEEAFKRKWELHIAQGDLNRALATCETFSRIYPDSPFVDQALMGMAKINLEEDNFQTALTILGRVLRLANSQSKPEAQFTIAQTIEKQIEEQENRTGREGNYERAIREYKVCAEKYPESEFAGESLGKLIDYHIKTQDYSQADELLTQVFEDYPDANFLDGMLLKWVVVSYRMRNFPKAYEKCSQLIFEYPGSSFAEKAKAILPKIEARVKMASAGPASE